MTAMEAIKQAHHQGRRDTLARSAYTALRHELSQSLLEDPSRLVRTPGFAKHEQPASDVVLDSFSGTSGEASLHDLLSMVGAAARGEDIALRAALWISVRAAEHANYHQEDAFRLMLEGGE